MKNQKAFTLIETIIYAVLVSLIGGFSIFVLYQIIDSGDRLKAKIDVEGEANFILQKVNWALNGATAVNQPAAGATSTILSINKNNFSSNPIVFDLNEGNIRLAKGGGAASFLNNQNISVGQLVFEHLAASGGSSEAIRATLSVNSKIFNYSKTIEMLYYLRN
ncbi:type II secretion system protein [Candidatus Wolfebacteria bacterium]|nr:type II secretion system protein [Candidatus Wolfebacteria bacterium]